MGGHDLGRAFPSENFWEQCGYCGTIWKAELENGYQPAAACPACDVGKKGLVALSLCEHCSTFRLVPPEDAAKSLFTGPDAAGLAAPNCGACNRAATRPRRDHYCLQIGLPFRTARQICPFDCGAGLFPASPAEYEASVDGSLRHSAWLDIFDIDGIRLVEAPPDVSSPGQQAQFILWHDGDARESIVLPQVATFEECHERENLYEQLFDYGDDSVGEVIVVKPAVVERARIGWHLTQRGALSFTQPRADIFEEEEEEEWQDSLDVPEADPAVPEDAEEVGRVEGGREDPQAEPKNDPNREEQVGDDLRDGKGEDSAMPPYHKKLAFVAVVVLAVLLAGYTLLGRWAIDNRNVNPTPTPTPAPTPAPKQAPPPGMVEVHGTTFTMGRDGDHAYESPAHQVPVHSFFMDEYEVSREEYAEFIRKTGYKRSPAGWTDGASEGDARLPVTGVSWQDANAYCAAAGKRLPTEEEWEYAARGTDGRLYPWGNEWQDGLANVGHEGEGPAVRGRYGAQSPFGAYDMVGNVWEWTASQLRPYPGSRIRREPGVQMVIRGGCYLNRAGDVSATTTYRGGLRPEDRNGVTGFRCAKEGGP
jgi:formylglycine-generating enzyme required for sulfatase activity